MTLPRLRGLPGPPGLPRTSRVPFRLVRVLTSLALGVGLWLGPGLAATATTAAPWGPSPGRVTPMMPADEWPAGRTSTGQQVSWTAHRSRHTSYRQATGWWGAATTKIRIRSARAPHLYHFHLRLPAHVQLAKNHFGEVVASRRGHVVGLLGHPWAKDAGGHHLRSWYTVHGRVLVQHVRFGRHTRFPVTADPWWNPFTWHWSSLFAVAWSEVTSCGEGAIKTMSYVAAPTALTNILLVHVAGRAALMVPGGAYAYAALAVYGCLGSYFGSD